MTIPLKAYVIQEEYGDEHVVIRFAAHNVVARREGANELDNEFEGVSCRRAPEFDEYAPGPVPPTVKIDNGWWMECLGCYTVVNRDDIFQPVNYGDQIFCSQSCKDQWKIDRDMERRIKAATLQWLEMELLKRLPGARPSNNDETRWHDRHVYVDRKHVNQASLGFRFPGCKIGNGHIRFDKPDEEPHVSVCQGDLEAFEAWKAAGYPAESGQAA